MLGEPNRQPFWGQASDAEPAHGFEAQAGILFMEEHMVELDPDSAGHVVRLTHGIIERD